MAKSTSQQINLKFAPRGGKRRGAGRKPNGPTAGLPHLRRPKLASRHPVHVTLRVHEPVWNLRTRRCFRLIAPAFRAMRARGTFRLAEYSIQGNHLHLIIEADDARCLARGMQSLEIRVAKKLNKLMNRSGPVFADRYHAHILRTPTEVANALRYVRGNFAVHAGRRGETVPDAADQYSSAILVEGALPHEQDGPLVSEPKSWLLSIGWHRAR